MKNARLHSDTGRDVALKRSRAMTYHNVVDAGIFVLPVFQMACLANGHYKTAVALGSVVVVSAFLHNHFLKAAQDTFRSENTASGNFPRFML